LSWKPELTGRIPRLAVLLAGLLSGFASAAAPDSNRAALDALRARIEKLQSEVESTRGERDEVRARLRDLERRIGVLVRGLHDTDVRMRAETRRLNALEHDRDQLHAELVDRRHDLDQAIRAAYALGNQAYLKLLLSQEDPARVSRVLTYYRYIATARADRIADITGTLARLDATEAKITERQHDLAGLHAEQLQQKATLEAARRDRHTVLAKLNERLTSRSQEIDRLKRDEQRLTRLVRELSTALAETPAPPPVTGGRSLRKGHWLLPVRGRVVARFDSPKAMGSLRWRGIFIAAPEGTKVRAVARGRIAYADWLRGFGLLMVIDHGGGLMTLYGHNQSLYKGVGDQVEAGEVIAVTGNTGAPPQPGLYFEVREQGEPRNPLDWCRL
jgi:septal ring factor EnvC (AmiA/AmiB activator)